MKQMRFFVVRILCLALVFGFVLAGCGGGDGDDGGPSLLIPPSIELSDIPAGDYFDPSAIDITDEMIEDVVEDLVSELLFSYQMVQRAIRLELNYHSSPFNIDTSLMIDYLNLRSYGISGLSGNLTGTKSNSGGNAGTDNLSYLVSQNYESKIQKAKVKVKLSENVIGTETSATAVQSGTLSGAAAFQFTESDTVYGMRAIITVAWAFGSKVIYGESVLDDIVSFTYEPVASINVEIYGRTDDTLIGERSIEDYDAIDYLTRREILPMPTR